MTLLKHIASIMFIAVVAALATSIPFGSAKAREIHVAGAYSADNIHGTRVGYRWVNISSEPLKSWVWLKHPTVHVESAINKWHNSNDYSDNIHALTLSPVLSWQLSQGTRPLYLEAGIGVSYLERHSINGRQLSTRFQFEDRIGISWQYSARSLERITLSYIHYSNAGIKGPNDGLDLIVLTLTKPF